MENSTPLIGLLVSILGIVSALSYKFYRDSKKDNTSSGFDKGKLETNIKYLQSEVIELHDILKDMQNDIEKGHLDNDSTLKRMADMGERLARLEGPR